MSKVFQNFKAISVKSVCFVVMAATTGCSTVQGITDGTPLALLTKTLPNAIEKAAQSKAETIPGPELYISIKKYGDSYVVSKITNVKGPQSICLNDLTPRFDTKSYDCGVEKSLISQTACPDLPEFYDTSLKSRNGRVYRKAFFSELLFQKAVNEAVKSLDRKLIISKYQGLIESEALSAAKKARADNVQFLNDQYSQIYAKYVPAYQAKFANAKLKLVVQDQSGFYHDDISANSLAAIEIRDYARLPLTLEQADALIDTTPENLDAALSEAKTKSLNIGEKYKAQVRDELEAYEKYLRDATSSLKVVSKNPASPLNGYHISTTVSENYDLSATQQPEVPVTLVVQSKDFYSVRPTPTISDKNVQLSYNGSSLTLTNKTDKYIQIKSISCYNGDVISTYQSEIELAPEATRTSYDLVEKLFSGNKFTESLNYTNMTASMARNKNLTFGFAVKYRLGEENVDRTLYKTDSYNLFKLLAQL
jgi:hypothetical protein